MSATETIFNKLKENGGIAPAAAFPQDGKTSDFINQMLDNHADPVELSSCIAKVLKVDLYSPTEHGAIKHQKDGAWAITESGRLFVANQFSDFCPLIPDRFHPHVKDWENIGQLVLTGKRVDSSSAEDRIQAEHLLDRWLDDALRMEATDLHIIPLTERKIRALARIDGQLQAQEDIPLSDEDRKSLFNIICRRANIETGAVVEPIDGRFQHRALEVRVAMRPVRVGAGASQGAAYLRFLGAQMHVRRLKQLGLPNKVSNLLGRLRKRNDGLILMTGPTGSGKSTTLYATLQEIMTADKWRSIQTVEDPVEQELMGVAQTQVNEKSGTGFAESLRSMVRSDVDVILVGEIRDTETAELTARAALTGHLVFATIHAASALSAINRLVDLGIKRQLLGDVVSGAFAQRLVRKLCSCAVDAETPKKWQAGIGATMKTAVGCEKCGGDGYRGRVLVAEGVSFSDDLKCAIGEGRPLAELRQIAARHSSNQTLWKSAIKLIRGGITDLDECLRHLPPIDTNFETKTSMGGNHVEQKAINQTEKTSEGILDS